MTLTGITELDQLEKTLDLSYPERNIPLAIKIHGVFAYIKTRSVPAQKKPYQKLSEVTKNQPVCERQDIAGTIVGFRLPAYFQGMAVPGYHFHFISDDKTFGGHVLEVSGQHLNVIIDDTPTFFLSLPTDKPFNAMKLAPPTTGQITAVEK
jgi:acetolactate decarboxylase